MLAPVVVEMDDTVTVASSIGGEEEKPSPRPAPKKDANLLIAPATTAFTTFKRACRRIYRKLGLKHCLSIALIIFYTIIGAGIFIAIEKPSDVARLNKAKADFLEKRRAFVRTLGNEMVTAGRTASAAQARRIIDARLQDYEDSIEFSVQNETEWNFWHAMYFAGTIYTTIGK